MNKRYIIASLSCGHRQLESIKEINGPHASVTTWITKMDNYWGLMCDKCNENREVITTSVSESLDEPITK